MQPNVRISPHETFAIHELLSIQNVWAAKATSLTAAVQDADLKTILEQLSSTSQNHMQELQSLLKQSDYYASTDYSIR